MTCCWVGSDLTRGNRFLEVFDGALLALEAATLVMMQPTELLQDLGMVGITVQYSSIRSLGVVVLASSAR